MLFVDNVIPDLYRFLQDNQKIALVTLVGVEGSSPRPLGSQVGVAADGRSVGMITGGCAEKAIVAEALRCLQNNENKIVRYGAGSPYLDVTLPCGSAIDLYIETKQSAIIVETIHAQQSTRKLAAMTIDLSGRTSCVVTASEPNEPDAKFTKLYEPDYRIFAFGEGANLISFCMTVNAAGFSVDAFSPDEETLEFLQERKISTHPIHSKTGFAKLSIDQYTAIITLFHEHEWESGILHASLNSQADYIGALGSKATHKTRLEALTTMPPTKQPPDVIHGPVGLDIGAQNPNEIAVSIIAEIVVHRQRKSL